MNKKLIIAFGISIFLGAGYWIYRESDYGRNKKAESILKKIEQHMTKNKISWKFPEEVSKGSLEELRKLEYGQLELIEKYVKDSLAKKGLASTDKHQATLKENGVDWTTDIPNLQDMLFNLSGLKGGYSKSAIATPVKFNNQ